MLMLRQVVRQATPLRAAMLAERIVRETSVVDDTSRKAPGVALLVPVVGVEGVAEGVAEGVEAVGEAKGKGKGKGRVQLPLGTKYWDLSTEIFLEDQ